MCPPGVDQTMRSPQQWLLYAPELEQRHSFTETDDGWGTKLNDITSSKALFDVWELLARPVSAATKVPTLKGVCCRGRFDILSHELIDMILEHVSDDLVDIMALGLTCEGFWSPVSQHIYRSFLKCAAPWANAKIIFQGSYSTNLPETLVSSPAVEKAVDEDGSWMPISRKLFWAGWNFDAPKTGTQLQEQWRNAAALHRESSGIPKNRWSEIQQQLSCLPPSPRDQACVLRNLTTKEVVSSEGPGRRRTRQGKSSTEMTFEDVLLMKTFWTTYPPYELREMECNFGDWAGHHFDIVTLKIHNAEGGEGWQDVTSRLEKEVMAWKKAQS
ncbi:hypothetical protein BKA64DRAFT_482129 [Cadophora sp. MPI-SDFR-AT-0126]|nr:hypothetical protein BKA64DRAFT_482129 [Leotiomycetes sp. MPI-SDFR-AT-0126]